jgi:hypothetical protein
MACVAAQQGHGSAGSIFGGEFQRQVDINFGVARRNWQSKNHRCTQQNTIGQGGDRFPLEESRQRANLHVTSTELLLDGKGSRSKGFGHDKRVITGRGAKLREESARRSKLG